MPYQLGLVQANDVISNNVILPLAAGMLWQAAANDEWQLTELIYTKDVDVGQAQRLSQCDMVAFSSYLWNMVWHVELAKQIKLINPDCYIVMGGPNIHDQDHQFWNKYSSCIDLAVVGEGELSFSKLLQQWPNVDVATIPGAWTSSYYAGQAERIVDLSAMPSPYLAGFYDDIVLREQLNGRNIQAVLQTNRGCPYHCTFCEEGKSYKNKMYFYDYQRMAQEIDWCGRHKIEYLSLADDNWGISPQDVELMRVLCETKIKYGYPNILDATYAKNAPGRVLEMAQLDHDMGTNLIRGITVSVQSGHTPTLESVKRFNLVPAQQHQFIQDVKKLGVTTYAELIWPLPYETFSTLCAGIDQNLEQGLDTWMGMYPLGLSASTDLHAEFADSYVFVDNQSGAVSAHVQINMPVSNKWVSADTVIQGHMLYTWLAVLYFFGFARIPFDHLKKQGKPITQSVNEFIAHMANSKIAGWHTTFTDHWRGWLHGTPQPNISIFPNSDTTHWYAYTHLASWIQNDLDRFYHVLGTFINDPELIAQAKRSICQFGINDRNSFDTLFEFSQYYYWWNRKTARCYLGPQ